MLRSKCQFYSLWFDRSGLKPTIYRTRGEHANPFNTAGADPGFQVRGGALKIFWGVFRVKNHDFTSKNLIFSNFRGARARCAPLWIRPCTDVVVYNTEKQMIADQ